jgi:hypothetical protein
MEHVSKQRALFLGSLSLSPVRLNAGHVGWRFPIVVARLAAGAFTVSFVSVSVAAGLTA